MATTAVRNIDLKDNRKAPRQPSPWYQSAILEHSGGKKKEVISVLWQYSFVSLGV